MKTLFIGLIILLFSACGMNEDKSNIVRKEHDAPAFHYLFFNVDSTLKEVYQGHQNVETKLAVDDETSFHAFSVTKTFTAVAIMQQVYEEKIKLDDPIQEHLPDYAFSQPITIRNLLCHQSGIANPLPLQWTHLANEHDNFDYEGFLDSIILNNLKLKRSPGTKYAYSNINYLVLGRLIEEVSGKPYQDYIADNILSLLPIEEHLGFNIPESNHAYGYHRNSWFQNLLLRFLLNKDGLMYKASKDWNGFRPFYNNGAPYGGIICTPNALRAFCQELLKDNENILPKSSIDKMLTEQQTIIGKNTGMTLGWFKGSLNEHDYYCHAGGGGGYYSEIRLYPSLGLGSVIMTNSSGMSDVRILDQLDRQYLNSTK